MSILRRLSKVLHTFALNQTSKNLNKRPIIEVLRTNKTFSGSIKLPKTKDKEPGEVIKWVLLMIPVTSFGLGCWQVYRLQWKLELIDMLQAKCNAPPVEIPENFDELESMEYRPVKVKGEFLHDKEILIGPRALIENDAYLPRSGSLISDPKKNQGWFVLTPFRLSDSGKIIIINRGWIPQALRPKEKRKASMVTGEVELTGLVRLTESRGPFMPKNNPEKGSWLYRDLDQISTYLGCEPVWLDAKGMPDPPEGWPLPTRPESQ